MRNLTRIAFVISLAACGEELNNQDDVCVADPTLPECQDGPIACTTNAQCESFGDEMCLLGVCADGVCTSFDECEDLGEASAELSVFSQENGNTFVGFVADFSALFDQLIDADEAEDAAVPINDCVEQEFVNIDGEPDRKPVGDVTITKGGAPVVTLAFDEGTGNYEDIVTSVLPGDTLDVAFPGDGAIGQHDLVGFAALPAAFPKFGGVVNNQIDLTSGIVTFDPLTGSYIQISTNFLDGQQSVSLICGTDGSGSLTIPPATLARMPALGMLNLTVTNRQFRPLTTTDGVTRSIRSVVRMTKSVLYTKP